MKQGDPISPSLFSAVLEQAMQGAKNKWRHRGFGIRAGGEDEWLTNLRFADDILLIGTSRAMIKEMLEDLKAAVGQVGLELHMGKTKVLRNEFGLDENDDKYIEIDTEKVEILSTDDSTMYLGRNLSLHDANEIEFDHRLGAAWRSFMARKCELCNKRYRLRDRLKLFEATVTKSVLYGSECWTMTTTMKRRLATTQRKMLRWMVGSGRRTVEGPAPMDSSSGEASEDSDEPQGGIDGDEEGQEQGSVLEDWVTWIVRTTAMAEKELQHVGAEDWVQQQKRQYWRWAGHVTRMTDARWTVKVLNWIPDGGSRRPGHPKKRWNDDLAEFIERKMPAGRGQKQLRYMMQNAGSICKGSEGEQKTKRWNVIWAKYEKDFMKS